MLEREETVWKGLDLSDIDKHYQAVDERREREEYRQRELEKYLKENNAELTQDKCFICKNCFSVKEPQKIFIDNEVYFAKPTCCKNKMVELNSFIHKFIDSNNNNVIDTYRLMYEKGDESQKNKLFQNVLFHGCDSLVFEEFCNNNTDLLSAALKSLDVKRFFERCRKYESEDY